MLFQIIDNKRACPNIYLNNKIVSDPDYSNLTGTWAYDPMFSKHDIKYASLYVEGDNLDDCCPDNLIPKWEEVKEKHVAFFKSFNTAKVNFQDYCLYDLLPESFVNEYFETKNKITQHVFDNYKIPTNYDFLVELSDLVASIQSKRLIINTSLMDKNIHELRVRKIKEKIINIEPIVSYNVFGTITGRLTTKKNSFPLLTLDKNYRNIIQPNNDWFVELDFNAAELRCLLALNEQPQPCEDIHNWHGKILNKLFDHRMERDEIKRKIFSWLYGPANVSLGIPEIERFYNKEKVIEKYWDGEEIVNPFGRRIKADHFHSLNAIIQSTTSDTFLRRAIAVNKLLKGRKSFTMGLIHDSMVIDFDRNDKDLLEELMVEFGNTDLGIFKVNASLGTNFGNMRKFR
jgi:hypothetical protein